MSSHDGRSLRQSKRMSVTAIYMSMSQQKDKELEIDDDLAKGKLGDIGAGNTKLTAL